jgi:flagellar basal-body rod protein FlgC
MSSVSAIALSGMNAALLRLNAAANNIANARSNGPLPGAAASGSFPPAFTPVDVVQVSQPGGGVAARLVPNLSGPVAVYDPSAPYADSRGFIATPNVDLAEQMVQLLTARTDYSANLKVLRTEYEMLGALLNIRV